MNVSAAMAAIAIGRVLLKDRPKMPAAMSAAVMAWVNQPSLAFFRVDLTWGSLDALMCPCTSAARVALGTCS
ncbi:MAG: hypothetical protein RL392_951 [Pseudomonadota bacterium]